MRKTPAVPPQEERLPLAERGDERDLANLSANLRMLCDRQGSISSVCRKLGVNRQQFNKYLSGAHVPSANNLRLFANFFGLSVGMLFQNPDDLRSLVEGNFFKLLDVVKDAPQFGKFMAARYGSSSDGIDDYLGVFDRYHYSSIYRGQILRSAFCIYRKGDTIQHCYVERFPSQDGGKTIDYVFKYHGFSVLLHDRLFCIDFETIQKNEMTFTNLAFVHRNSTRFMFGVASGISATMLRQPVANRIALHYRGKGLLRRSDLKRAGTLTPDDATIPKEVAHFLNDGTRSIDVASRQ